MASADPDIGKSPQQLLAERARRIQDALHMRQPDRIPIMLSMGYMLAEIGCITRQEQHEDGAKEQDLLERAAQHFRPDCIAGVPNNPGVALALGDRSRKFPGHGLDANGSLQFVEGEYMNPEDYDAFLEDASDWAIRKYWPRVFSELDGLRSLPPLGVAAMGGAALSSIGVFRAPLVVKALRAFAGAIEAQAVADAHAAVSLQRMMELGFAPFPIPPVVVAAPFDFMSDSLRGMRGIFLDMLRCPDKLLAAQEKVLRFQVEYATNRALATGINACFVPLHRGSDGFMSLAQFEKFYWPQLKALLVALVEAGIQPFVFYEGVWDQRLKYLAELPRGKTVGWFQSSDIFRVKEIVGGTMCIIGGMPNTLLQAGTVDEVRALTRELCQVVGKGGGYIMSVGISEMEGCEPELVKAWVDATREFGMSDVIDGNEP